MVTVLTLIAAVSADGFISSGKGVPWNLPEDKKHFRAYAHGKWLLLGRQTYEEMLGWFSDHHPLVLTRNEKFLPFLGERVRDVAEALQYCQAAQQPELVVCGGAGAYEAAMPHAHRLIITHVDDRLGQGVAFPSIDPRDWEPVLRLPQARDAEHEHAFDIVTYQRIRHYDRAA